VIDLSSILGELDQLTEEMEEVADVDTSDEMFSIDFLAKNIRTLPSISLCFVVVNFPKDRQMVSLCMNELTRRAEEGDPFDYMDAIDNTPVVFITPEPAPRQNKDFAEAAKTIFELGTYADFSKLKKALQWDKS
jgi:hypothetical protein